jgi:hypothetical protein
MNMPIRRSFGCLFGPLTLLLTAGCHGNDGPLEPEGEGDDVIAVQGPYMGQTPPGLTPQRFGPPVILATQSWFWHSSPAFSPDRLQMYWAQYVPPASMRLAHSTSVTGGWSLPGAPPFAGSGSENQPRFSSDGNSLYYISETFPSHILRVDRSGAGWSQPQGLGLPLPSGMGLGWQFSMAADGSVYLDGDLGQGGSLDLFRFPRAGSGYGEPVPVSVNSAYNEIAPFVAPDESYLIFSSNRPGGYGRHDLWIAFKRTDGSWTDPLNMGPDINTETEDGSPAVTHDGLYLFYLTERAGDAGYNPYWVSAQVIQELRNQALDATPPTPVPFERGQQQWPSWNTSQTALADLDGDGDLDAALAMMSDLPSRVLLNDGTGGFQDSGANIARSLHGVSVGDVDRDGDPDLIFVANRDDRPPSPIYLNQGQGRFAASASHLDSGGSAGVGVHLSDVDGDGDLDALAVYTTPTRRTSLFRNDGSGSFVPEATQYPPYCDFADLNGDGFLDMVAPGVDGALDVLLNDGTGRWILSSTLSGAGFGYDNRGTFADVDDDADMDFILPVYDSGVHVLIKDGTGRFSDSAQVLGSVTLAYPCAGDLNDDGYPDLVIAERDGPMQVWLNDGSGRFVESGAPLVTGLSLYFCTIGDLDGDEDLDIFVSAFDTGSNQIWFNRLVEQGG